MAMINLISTFYNFSMQFSNQRAYTALYSDLTLAVEMLAAYTYAWRKINHIFPPPSVSKATRKQRGDVAPRATLHSLSAFYYLQITIFSISGCNSSVKWMKDGWGCGCCRREGDPYLPAHKSKWMQCIMYYSAFYFSYITKYLFVYRRS